MDRALQVDCREGMIRLICNAPRFVVTCFRRGLYVMCNTRGIEFYLANAKIVTKATVGHVLAKYFPDNVMRAVKAAWPAGNDRYIGFVQGDDEVKREWVISVRLLEVLAGLMSRNQIGVPMMTKSSMVQISRLILERRERGVLFDELRLLDKLGISPHRITKLRLKLGKSKPSDCDVDQEQAYSDFYRATEHLDAFFFVGATPDGKKQ